MNTETTRDPAPPPAAKDMTKEAFQGFRDRADQAYHTVKAKADDTVQTVREKVDQTAARTDQYVRQHPLPTLLGAVAFGMGVGFLLAITRRPEPTFRERLVDEPIDATRKALYSVLAPLADRMHDSYATARDYTNRTVDKAHHFNGSRVAHSLSESLRRVADNLKFW